MNTLTASSKKNKIIWKGVWLGLALLLNACISPKRTQEIAPLSNKITFWTTPKKGANIFNTCVSLEDIRAAKAYGIQFIRLALDKFPSKRRDFLMGDADDYHSLDPDDLAFLKSILDMFTRENMPVVITMLSLPGSRWKQLNGDRDDLRIWTDAKFKEQAACFWRDLATELRQYQIVVGYNILNEPHPERLFDSESCNIDQVNQEEVQKLLSNFNNLIVNSIGEVDCYTPIIIDSSSYADPNTFEKLQLLKDSRVIYSFHMYEPYAYTNHRLNKGQYSYPGEIEGKYWDRAALEAYMVAVNNFQKQHKIPSNRIFVGEFGGHRMQKGLPQYFEDLIAIFEKNNWHWAFYAFRDNWDGMDYE
ncbi:MAG: glycoside hydrolase family 5 protein, partial [Puniceicoccales bacterium]|nr:glycoside hydrolase family 5 protein [Puniceicoccales bacterium]